MYVDINQCQSVVANFPNDIETISSLIIFISFLYNATTYSKLTKNAL